MANKETITAVYKLQDQMSKDLKKITKQMEGFEKETEQSSKEIQSWTKHINVGTVSAAAFAVAAVKTGKALAGATKEVIHQANQIKKFSDSTTIATKTISSLTTAVKRGGGEIDNVGDIVQDFTEKLGDAKDGSQTYRDAFNRLGVDISGSPQQALEKTIDTLANMDDKSAALFRGIELFGDSYKLISNQIAEGNNVLNESPLFSDDLIRASQSFTQNVSRMGTELKTAVNQSLAPFIGDLDELIVMLDDSGMWDNFVDGISRAAGWAEKLSSFMKDAVLAANQIALEKQQEKYTKLTEKLANVTEQVLDNSRKVVVVNGQAVAYEVDKTKLIEEQNKLFDERAKLAKEIEQREKNLGKLVAGATPTTPRPAAKSIKEQVKEVETLVKAYQPLFDFTTGGAGVQPEPVEDAYVQMLERRKTAQEQALIDAQTFQDGMRQLLDQGMNSTFQIADAIAQNKINNLEAEKRAQIDAVKTSTMSEKKKNEEIAKIEQKAAAESLKLRQNQWRADLLQSVVNTALSVTRTSKMGFPQAIPFMAAAGVAGAAQTAVIAANKPRFENGGIVGGTSFTGDNVDARVNSGEMILNRSQQKQLFDMANGGTTNNNQRTINVNVSALDPQTTSEAVVNALVHAQQNGGYDTSILSLGA